MKTLTPQHRHKISIAIKALGNGWLGRRHTEESKQRMKKPKSLQHRLNMREAALRRWARSEAQRESKQLLTWVQSESTPRAEPIQPMSTVYRDIFMDDKTFIADNTVWTIVED